MNEIILKKISYQQIKERNWLEDDDSLGMAAFMNDNVRSCFLDSPFNTVPNKTAMLLAVNNGLIVGRYLLYGSSIKVGDKKISAQSFGSIEVHPSQRGRGIGSMMSKWTLENKEESIFLCSLLSDKCLSLMRNKHKDCVIFDFPKFFKPKNIEAALKSRGVNGLPLKLGTAIGNGILKCLDVANSFRLKKLKKCFVIRQEQTIPEWVGYMCLNDGHKYAEYHDKEWFEWNLRHNLTGQTEDKQYFYAIYKDDKPVGFFFTKIRLREAGKCKRMFLGTLCEWGSIDPNLKEEDINLLAFDVLPDYCYYMVSVSDNEKTRKGLLCRGFFQHDSMQMGIKDKMHQFSDIDQMELWRIRFGCCNSVLY